ncbi:MAG TPA: glucose-6-phosphate dehydrogenase assembly protein OpcA [Candidatus Dormibacteraeota bacterium]|nr:glucose-6-phosphate dehydrogenase assembly protein OpcA [Candidatus Dormibacteraeota bacterium]
MTTTQNTNSEPDWHGEGVTIADVLTALNDIRRKFAREQAGDDEHPRSRNRVMTLVAVAASGADERRALRACRAIAVHHPSLAIVIRDEPNIASGRLNASIATDTHQNSNGIPLQFELVTLHIEKAAGEHLAALVDPLLLSGVPTYLWWLGTPPFGTRGFLEALKIGDALVIDSTHFERPYNSFLALAELDTSAHQQLGVADFQWQRLAPWREMIAQFFEPKDRRLFMSGIGEVGIDYVGDGRGNRIAAALLVGWFSSALGWKMHRAVGGTGGVVAAHFEAAGNRSLEVTFRPVPKTHLSQGEVSAVRITGASGGKTFQLSIQRDPERPRRVGPDGGAGEFRQLHSSGGDDDAGAEVAERKAAQHREMLLKNREALHHTATGDLPGENEVKNPTVLTRDRRHGDSALVLLTMIDIGGAETLRHVQHVESEDEATLLLELLSTGAHDTVYARSLAAAAELMRSL